MVSLATKAGTAAALERSIGPGLFTGYFHDYPGVVRLGKAGTSIRFLAVGRAIIFTRFRGPSRATAPNVSNARSIDRRKISGLAVGCGCIVPRTHRFSLLHHDPGNRIATAISMGCVDELGAESGGMVPRWILR